MNILYLLVPFSVALVFLIGLFFWWALHNRQFDDLEAKGRQILEEDQDTQKNPDQ